MISLLDKWIWIQSLLVLVNKVGVFVNCDHWTQICFPETRANIKTSRSYVALILKKKKSVLIIESSHNNKKGEKEFLTELEVAAGKGEVSVAYNGVAAAHQHFISLQQNHLHPNF